MNASSLRTSAYLALVAALALSGTGLAQSAAPPTATQTTQQAQTQDPKTGAPIPAVEPRFEKPGAPRRTQKPDPDRAVEDLRKEIEATQREPEWVSFRPVFRLGQDYTLRAGERVRQVVGVMASLQIDGQVDQDAVAVAGNVTLGSTAVVDGNLVVVGGVVTIQPGARVNRDFVVVGGTVEAPADFVPRGEHVVIGPPIIGDSIRSIMPWFTRGLLWGRLIVPDLAWIWAIVGIAFVIGLLLNHVFDRQVAACADTLVQRPLSAFLMGLLVMLVSGPLLIILAASVIGLAVVPFAAVALVVAKIIGKVGVSRAIGRGVIAEDESGSRAQSARSYVLGFAVIVLAYMVPIIGLLTYLMVGTFGLGSATMAFVARWRKERTVPPVTPAPQPPAGPPSSADVSGASWSGPGQGPAPTLGAPTASAFVAADAAAPTEDGGANMMNEGAPPPAPPVAPPPLRPAPGPAAVAGGASDLLLYPRASFFDRIAAFLLDVVLIAIGTAFIRSVFWFRWWGDDGGFMLVLLAYTIGFIAWKGTTLGGIICSVRVVRTTGGDPRPIDALVRGLSAIFSVVALCIGVFWMLTDSERQMWHDKIAGTVVVKVPRELVLA
jgi:uncharacterized RDD family membrane protein YckC